MGERRIDFLERLAVASIALLWGTLFLLQGLQGSRFRKQAEKNRTRLIHLPASRGAILDRHGVKLVEDGLGFECAVFPQELKSPEQVWRKLGHLVNLPAEELERRYTEGFQGPFAPVPLVRNLDPSVAFLLEEKRSELPGILVRPLPQRRYRLGQAVAPVAGYVGLIAPEELSRLKPYGYTFRDWVGKDGLEKQYDPILRGEDGGLQVEVNARGQLVRQLSYRPPVGGKSITTSLDARLQSFCFSLLGEAAGAVVVMDAASGEILAMVSRPIFDPNAFVDPQRQREVKRFLRHPNRPMFNRASRAEVPPGSTFKMAVAYEALQSKKIGQQTAFVCDGAFELGNALFRCWREEGHGPQVVEEALEHSCNFFFYQTGRRLGAEGIHHAASLFGLGRPTGIDLPYESKGLVPDPAWMRSRFHQPWQEGDTVSFAIGQGPLTVTPLQMLMLTTALAKDGLTPQPHLVAQPTPRPRALALDSKALKSVQEGLKRVVASPTGTGRIAQLSGVASAGKTGTAQASAGPSHAWFCGYTPPDQPQLSFVIFLEHGGKGGEQAALVARDLLVYLKELHYL